MSEIKNIDKLIDAVLEMKATTEEQEMLEKWRKADPANSRYFSKAYSIKQGITPAFNPEDIDTKKAKEKVFSQINRERSSIRQLTIYWQRISAILVIPLLLSIIYLFLRGSGEERTTYQELFAPYGMYSKANLPDGSKVWLNGGSSLKYPIRFTGGKRSVLLSGEGYFEVQANPEKPFMVITESMTLRATGTSFNIEAYKTDSITAITLAEGKVEVSLKNNPATALHPGERILYNNSTSKGTITKTADPYKWYAWKDGLMIFRDDPLEYVFKRLSLIFNVNISIKDTELNDAPYRATFEEESLDEILRLLELTAPIKFIYTERGQNADSHFDKQTIEVHMRKRKST